MVGQLILLIKCDILRHTQNPLYCFILIGFIQATDFSRQTREVIYCMCVLELLQSFG